MSVRKSRLAPRVALVCAALSVGAASPALAQDPTPTDTSTSPYNPTVPTTDTTPTTPSKPKPSKPAVTTDQGGSAPSSGVRDQTASGGSAPATASASPSATTGTQPDSLAFTGAEPLITGAAGAMLLAGAAALYTRRRRFDA